MSIVGTAQVRCPACGTERSCELVQSINTRTNPAAKQRLLAGDLNVLACGCGKRAQLAANILFHDPDAAFLCQVCPGGDGAMSRGAEAFETSGATGTLRLVPSLNALVEKVKMLDAGLEDWAIEMTKVLLLASLDVRDLDRVLLFDRIDRPANVLRWVLFAEGGGSPENVSSSLAAYEKLVARSNAKPTRTELQIDRAWAMAAVRMMIANAN
jgi:hypothetical protein